MNQLMHECHTYPCVLGVSVIDDLGRLTPAPSVANFHHTRPAICFFPKKELKIGTFVKFNHGIQYQIHQYHLHPRPKTGNMA